MNTFVLWPTFPYDLSPPQTRSLALLLLLQQWVQGSLLLLRESSPEILFNQLFGNFSLPFPQKGGIAPKICLYSSYLVQASKINAPSLCIILEKMRSKFLQQPFQPAQDDLKEQFTQIFQELIPFLFEARSDENILIYLLEERQTIDAHLGEGTLVSLLKEFFPEGKEHLNTAISEGFTRRGFTQFLQNKEMLLQEIEWEMNLTPPH